MSSEFEFACLIVVSNFKWEMGRRTSGRATSSTAELRGPSRRGSACAPALWAVRLPCIKRAVMNGGHRPQTVVVAVVLVIYLHTIYLTFGRGW